MGYDRGDCFSFDFEPNGIPCGSKLKGKLSPRSYPIQYERKWKYGFLSVAFPSLGETAYLIWLRRFYGAGVVIACHWQGPRKLVI